MIKSPSEKILIADDHALMRMALHDSVLMLRPQANIMQTDTPNNIPALLNSHRDISIILLDLFMPGNDVFCLIKEIREHHPHIKIIVISASEKKQHIRKAIENGVHSYIPKSSDMHTIHAALQAIFDGEQYLPDCYRSSTETAPEEFSQEAMHGYNPELIEARLTNRQLEIFQLLGEGKSNKQIASKMYISVNTVKIHVSAILKSLELMNRSQAGILSRTLYH